MTAASTFVEIRNYAQNKYGAFSVLLPPREVIASVRKQLGVEGAGQLDIEPLVGFASIRNGAITIHIFDDATECGLAEERRDIVQEWGAAR